MYYDSYGIPWLDPDDYEENSHITMDETLGLVTGVEEDNDEEQKGQRTSNKGRHS